VARQRSANKDACFIPTSDILTHSFILILIVNPITVTVITYLLLSLPFSKLISVSVFRIPFTQNLRRKRHPRIPYKTLNTKQLLPFAIYLTSQFVRFVMNIFVNNSYQWKSPFDYGTTTFYEVLISIQSKQVIQISIAAIFFFPGAWEFFP